MVTNYSLLFFRYPNDSFQNILGEQTTSLLIVAVFKTLVPSGQLEIVRHRNYTRNLV